MNVYDECLWLRKRAQRARYKNGEKNDMITHATPGYAENRKNSKIVLSREEVPTSDYMVYGHVLLLFLPTLALGRR